MLFFVLFCFVFLMKVGQEVPRSIHVLPLSVVFLPENLCDLEN